MVTPCFLVLGNLDTGNLDDQVYGKPGDAPEPAVRI